MKTLIAFVFAGAVASSSVLPASSQNYHYNYGGGRVVNQNNIGLSQHSSTYIGTGTMSQSAQGKGAGVGNSALPSVPLGSHVRTAGDNMYNNQGSNRMSNGALIYQDQADALTSARTQKYRQAQQRVQMRQMQQMQQQRQGNFYVPGSNGAAATYGNAPSTQMQYSGSGAATYGGGYSDKGSGARSF